MTPARPVPSAQSAPVVLLGGSGKTGRRIAQRLTQADITVRLASRSTATRFDWTRPDTWPQALAGARAAYLAFQPDLALPGAAETVAAVAREAARQGVGRMVLLSGRGEAGARQAEAALAAETDRWTVLRCSWFNQNFTESFMVGGILEGELRLPAGPVAEPFVDVEDIADAAVAALVTPDHAGRIYELTGPEPLTFGEATAIIGSALGRSVRYTRVPVRDFIAALLANGLPADAAPMLEHLFEEVLDGRNSAAMPGVEQALGRPPRRFADFAARAAAAGAWDTPSGP